MPGPRAAGRAAWRVQAFCLRQNLGGGGIHFRRAFISNGVPAGRQPCGAVLPWSTWAMMATFLKCSFCISSISFSSMARPRGAPRRGARRMARTSVLPAAKPWRRRNSFPPSIYIKRGPRRASALWGGLAVVDVGDDGDIPQMFILHIFNLLFFYGKATRGPAPRGAPGGGSTHATSLPAARFRPQVEICTQFCIICRSLVFCKPFLPGFSKKTAGFCNFYGKAPAEAPLLRRFR